MTVDPRILRVGVTVNGKLKIIEGLAITAQGSKFASATQNETTIKIANLDKATRDFLSTQATPFNRINQLKRQRVYIEAGRVSTGVARIFTGDITLVTPSQPPDIWLTIKAMTGQFFKGEAVSSSEPPLSMLSQISQKAADSLGMSLKFSADDKQIANYSYTGSKTKQVEKIGELANVDAYVDDDALVVKNKNAPLTGRKIIVSAKTGMIGIPEFTDFGVKVRMLFNKEIRVGDAIETVSEFYPATNGTYINYKMDFDLCNRDGPFNLILETRRPGGVFVG